MNLSDELRKALVGTSDHVLLRPSEAVWVEFKYDHQQVAIRAADELDRLTTALPKTADGVTTVPGMEGLFTVYEGNVYGPYSVCSVAHDREVEMSTAHDHIPDWHSPSAIYSTRTAAEEAAHNGR